MTERLYYADSFLTQFDAVVTEIQELSRTGGHSLWQVALDRSAFYPTSGGQPHDTGHLLATARSGVELTAEIVGVEEDERGEVWHHTAKPLSPGTTVRGVVDIDRRLDHIQQHSGQHLLSAAFLAICGAPTVSFHLGQLVSTIDLATDTLPSATLDAVEDLANRIIVEDRPVTIQTVSREQAQTWFAAGQLRKLPEREGDLRVIEIAGESAESAFDLNACGGTHVRSTGQIGSLHLRGMEKVRQGWRVSFVCGLRAMLTARQDFQILSDAGRQLSISPGELLPAIQRLQEELRQSTKQQEAQRLELTHLQAREIFQASPVQDGIRRIQRCFTAPEMSSPAEAKQLTSALIAQGEKTLVLLSWTPADSSQPSTILLACTPEFSINCGELLKNQLQLFDGRGGGSRTMAQGSVATRHLESVLAGLASVQA